MTSTYAMARSRYVNDAIETVPPARLVVMLYDALVKDLVLAEQAIEARDVAGAHHRLVHAQDVVSELQLGLRPEQWEGGPALAQTYQFLYDQLVAANVHKDLDRVAACRRLVEPLADAWHEAARQLGFS